LLIILEPDHTDRQNLAQLPLGLNSPFATGFIPIKEQDYGTVETNSFTYEFLLGSGKNAAHQRDNASITSLPHMDAAEETFDHD